MNAIGATGWTAEQAGSAFRLFAVVVIAALVLGLFTRRVGGDGGGAEAGIVPALFLVGGIALGLYMAAHR